jgi:hypothetical protein
MSYDLYFYRSKDKGPNEKTIRQYLSTNLVNVNEQEDRWLFTNDDTEVYYSVEYNEPDADTAAADAYAGFEATNFSFDLNFIRPSFFGLEAFAFVETFTRELGLFVLNPQGSDEGPVMATAAGLYENWNLANLQVSADYFGKMGATYMSLESSNAAWRYNYNRKQLQEQVGEGYFVPRLIFLKKGDTAVTLAVWPEHVPLVVPTADYYLLARRYKRLFKTVEEEVVVTRATLMQHFGSFMSDFMFEGCRVIHPQHAGKIGDLFNSVKGDETMEFAQRLPVDKLLNALPV